MDTVYERFYCRTIFQRTRIHAIHEGTTAIHGMDLLGRKVMLKNGKAVMLLTQEVLQAINLAKQHENTKTQAIALEKKLGQLQELSMHLISVAQKEGVEAYLSDATLYLELFGIIVMGWQWLKMGNACNENATIDQHFKDSKYLSLNYFFEYELPKSEGLLQRLKSTKRVTVNVDNQLID
ncbi:MAG: acyl-CoA dehydrogenase [Chitinophagales bacterium]